MIKKKKKKESFSERVLNALLEKSLDFFDLSFKILFDPQELIRSSGMLHGYASPVNFSGKILKRSPYFKNEGKNFYVTERGRLKIIKTIIRSKINKKGLDKKWNGKWFGIIFDIPEANRKERSFLRRELNMAGCKELQKSVWITPFDIEKELLALLNLWKKDFRGDIRFIKIEKISGEDEIMDYFKFK